jgi:hypothetical protein
VDLIFEFLVKDVTVWGDVKTPMLSWIGSCGIILFFLWQLGKFLREVYGLRQPFSRVRPTLLGLLAEADNRKTIQPASVQENPPGLVDLPVGIDRDSLEELDESMADELIFTQSWSAFRKSLLVDHAPWFLEPRIYSTRRAEEYFTHETLLGGRINLAFYGHFPAVLTGIGLMLTFLALFIGLSKLHAEGPNITGVQGLINGLAGKFLTSIVGLVCANIFALIEKPLVHRLVLAHQDLLGLIDRLFPRRTIEQILDEINLRQIEQSMALKYPNTDLSNRVKRSVTDSLAPWLTELSTTIRGMHGPRLEDSAETLRAIVSELAQSLQAASHSHFEKLGGAIQALTTAINGGQLGAEPRRAGVERRLAEVLSRTAATTKPRVKETGGIWTRPSPEWKGSPVKLP